MSFSTSASIVVKSSLQNAWDALTNPDVVKKYFFGTNLDTTWKVGTPIFFRGEWEGKAYEDKGTVLEFNPPHSLSFDYLSSFSESADIPENYQIICYSVKEKTEGVEITITQSKIPSQELADHSRENWEALLLSYKELIEN